MPIPVSITNRNITSVKLRESGNSAEYYCERLTECRMSNKDNEKRRERSKPFQSDTKSSIRKVVKIRNSEIDGERGGK